MIESVGSPTTEMVRKPLAGSARSAVCRWMRSMWRWHRPYAFASSVVDRERMPVGRRASAWLWPSGAERSHGRVDGAGIPFGEPGVVVVGSCLCGDPAQNVLSIREQS